MAYKEEEIKDSLGSKDYKFYIVEKRASHNICYEQNFYKKFASLDAQFILTDDNQYIDNNPQVLIK